MVQVVIGVVCQDVPLVDDPHQVVGVDGPLLGSALGLEMYIMYITYFNVNRSGPISNTYRQVDAIYEEGSPNSVLFEAVQHLRCPLPGPVVKSQVNLDRVLVEQFPRHFCRRCEVAVALLGMRALLAHIIPEGARRAVTRIGVTVCAVVILIVPSTCDIPI